MSILRKKGKERRRKKRKEKTEKGVIERLHAMWGVDLIDNEVGIVDLGQNKRGFVVKRRIAY